MNDECVATCNYVPGPGTRYPNSEQHHRKKSRETVYITNAPYFTLLCPQVLSVGSGKLNSVTHLILLFVLGGFRFVSLHTHFYIFALTFFFLFSFFYYTGSMKRDTLIQAISQFALFSVALAAHDHRRGGREAWGEGGKRLAPYHFQDIPHCMVDCIYRMDRSDLPHVCSPFSFFYWLNSDADDKCE